MSLAAPILDDRRFQDLVDEAKNKIPHYTPKWTDHNVSDPGVTLIELFAWLTETTLFRLNRVPERHYVKFMEMLGMTLQPPMPAKAPVTFWLTAPQESEVTINVGTEVATTQTETESSIIFTTDTSFVIQPPELNTILKRYTRSNGKQDYATALSPRRFADGIPDEKEPFEVFSSEPKVNDALYFGFTTDMSHHILGFEMAWQEASGSGIHPALPPLIWEASTGSTGTRWVECEWDLDTTKGFNTNGSIQIHVPKMGKLEIRKKELYWIRVRVKQIKASERDEGMEPYSKSPLLRRMISASWGGTIPATHSHTISKEILGSSDGSAGQRFQLKVVPVLERREGEHVIVHLTGEEAQAWQEVADFAESEAKDKHYTIDSNRGEVRLGPAIRQPDGDIKLYGAIPPRDAQITFSAYRTGGGDIGNVRRGILNTLKTAIPFVAKVSNRTPAEGGLDQESLEDAMIRAPKIMRHRDRAVTPQDYEDLALSTSLNIGRAKCIQTRPSEAGLSAPGQVYVTIIPKIFNPARLLTQAELSPDPADITRLRTYLDERRLLTVRLRIEPPAYRGVSVRVELGISEDADRDEVEKLVLDKLYTFLNPLTGWRDGKGWPFGRDLYASDVFQCLQGLAGIQYFRSVELYDANPGGEKQGSPLEVITTLTHSVIASGVHEVVFV
ncbi:MAG: putative baseplate assembly protein [Anaerolineales bacterium]|nr:putative baseplate assembly protein [Anaerolineales bacterium]